MKVLVLNCGSSSVKYELFAMAGEHSLAEGRLERVGMDDAILSHRVRGRPEVKEVEAVLDHLSAVRRVLQVLNRPQHGVISRLEEIAAVGHRVVHGGETLTDSVLITPAVKDEIRRHFDIAPLHNPHNLTGILAAEAELPGVPQVAVFDTGFHATMPREAYLYALPYVLYRRHRIRRYGFHGTSHRYVSARLAHLLGRPLAELKLITCHLGNGCSLCAVAGGASVDTSMGFTPLEGLVMGTRSGDVDPGVLPFVMAKEELTVGECSSLLNKHSGLLGLSGISGDMREIEEEMAAGNTRAREAFAIFIYRLRKYIGAYAAALDGVDAIAFAGGIGENSWRVRQAVLEGLTFLGLTLDPEANRSSVAEKQITRPGGRVTAWVVPTDEELVIARDTVALVQAGGAAG